jgi:hypothetical protein
MSGHQYYRAIVACKAEFTHNMEVSTKRQKKLNMVLKYREYDDTFRRVVNNIGDEMGEIL